VFVTYIVSIINFNLRDGAHQSSLER